jgi:gamma-glutamyl-gamma-aminobutyrate hydrolase PuuD
VEASRIGITSGLKRDESAKGEVARHCAAVERVGATPVILRKDMDAARVVADLELNGLVFTGGGDLNASHYGGREDLVNDRLDDERDHFEMQLLKMALDEKVATLCVCRGLELANVVMGGTLIEDLEEYFGALYLIQHDQLKAGQADPASYAHTVKVLENTLFAKVVSERILSVNSFHHQAVRELAPHLRATAVSADGIIEAFECNASLHPFFLGVQWHPEALCAVDLPSQRLYAALSDAASSTRPHER